MARNFFCSGQKGVDAPQKSAGFSFGAGNVEITASNIFSKVTFFQKSGFTTSGWRCCVVFSSSFALPRVSRRRLTDSAKEHDAPLAPLAFASTCGSKSL